MKKTQIPWSLVIAGLKNDINHTDKALLEQWLISADNRILYEELGKLWESIRKDTSDYHPDVEFYWKKLQTRINKGKKTKHFRFGWKTITTISAAVVLVAISLSVLFTSNYTEEYPNMQTYTSFNGKSKITLPDGSIVWLNKGSTIEYSTSFAKDRHLNLDGEALFDVTKNPESPFVVYTAGIQVKVYGTQFNVNSYSRDTNVSIALIEGAVSIITDKKETHLIPGEIATFNKEAQALSSKQLPSATPGLSAQAANIQNTITKENQSDEELKFESFWASENFTFEHKDLGHICKYLEKWYKVDIHLDSTLVKSQYYTFTLKDEPLELILRIMSKINPISYSFTEENVVYITSVNPKK